MLALSEKRAGGRFVHVEASPGVVVVVAAWMLDRHREMGPDRCPSEGTNL